MKTDLSKEIIEELNPVQKEAVLYFDSPLLIIAGAGSGKTKVITHKISHMVQEKGILPMNILAVTFTNRAANEMRERVEKLTDIDKNLFNISTFHSLGLRILRETINYSNYDEEWKVIDDRERKKILEKIIKTGFSYYTNDKRDRLFKKISYSKMNLNYPNNKRVLYDRGFEDDEVLIYSLYFEEQNKNKLWDYEDLISLPVLLLQNNKELKEKYSRKYKYVLVDEFQDTNPNQYKLIKLIAGEHQRITIVGDDDQAIYSWRGANIRFLFEFENDFPGVNIIKLEQNYRSTKNILAFANDMIKKNKRRRTKIMWTEKDDGSPVYLIDSSSAENEAENISDLILLLKKKRPEIFPIAVLYRINSQSLAFENEFLSRNINFKILKGLRFFDRKEVKDALSLLQIAVNIDDNYAFMRMVDFLPLGVGPKLLDKLYDKVDSENISLFIALEKFFNDKFRNKDLFNKILEVHNRVGELSFSEILSILINYSGYRKILEDKGYDDKLSNINELILFIEKWESTRENAKFTELSDTISLTSNTENNKHKIKNDVFLLTMHNAKGMEFPTVICAGINNRFMPFYMKNMSNLKDIEEERRLFYVASTRAMQQLIISGNKYASSYFLDKITPSLYISLDSIYDIDKTRKSIKTFIEEKKQKEDDSDVILVEHSFFGKGKIIKKISEKKYRILFDKKGEKEIDTSIVPIKFL